MVSRLSGMDALSLHTETATMPAHAVALIVIEASKNLSHEALHALVASSLPQLARFRSRLIDKPFGVGQPVWAEIDDYEAGKQIHRASVPRPGGRREFAALIAELTEGPLDRHLPLWEAWSINGLPRGRWALAVKMSHAMSDGVGGVAAILPRLLTLKPDDDPGNDLAPEPSLGRAPSLAALLADTAKEVGANQLTGARLVGAAVPGLARGAIRGLRGGDKGQPEAPSPMSGPIPRTVFNASLTPRREVAFASIALSKMKAVKNAFGVSVNDVFLAACTLSVRNWLLRHSELPVHPLLIQMPLSLRDADSTSVDNQFTFGRLRFPVQLTDPVQVLNELHTATERLKSSRSLNAAKGAPAIDFPTIAQLIPPNVVQAGWQLYTGLRLSQRLTPMSHGIVSNIPGPPMTVYCAGAPVIGMHTAAPLVEGSGLNITLISHGDVMDLSVCVCPDHVSPAKEIADGIVESVGFLVAAAKDAKLK